MRKFFVVVCAMVVVVGFSGVAGALQVTIPDVLGYGYNSGSSPFVGCGPTSGVMILDTYDNRGVAPGLIVDPLADAWNMHYNYMGTNDNGFGAPSDFHFGVEQFAFDRGYIVDAVVHVEPTTFNPAQWSAYTVGPDLALDATFWNTSTWDIIDNLFLDFLAVEIDADRPVVLTVDSDSNGGDDHWMVGVGYDRQANQWAGYNTWDNSLHWYDVSSAFIAGNTMGIGFVRTFEFLGPLDDPDPEPPVPEPGTMFLLGTGLLGLVYVLRKRRSV